MRIYRRFIHHRDLPYLVNLPNRPNKSSVKKEINQQSHPPTHFVQYCQLYQQRSTQTLMDQKSWNYYWMKADILK